MTTQGRYLAWGVIVVATLLVVVLALIPRGAQVAMDIRRSSLRTSQDGVAAFARSMQAMGRPVEERYFSYTESPPEGAVEVLIEPHRSPSAGEISVLLDWVRGGGVLVYSPSLGELPDSLGFELRSEFALADSAFFVPHRWTEGVGEPEWVFQWGMEGREDSPYEWEPLEYMYFGSRARVALAWIPVGEGGVIVLVAGQALTNELLGTSSQAVVVARALLERTSEGEALTFSEFHLGNDGRGGLARQLGVLVLASKSARVVLYAGLVGLLLLVLAGTRFGSPIPVPRQSRRSPLEHIDALARIYRSAGAREAVADRLIRGAARRAGSSSLGPESIDGLLDRWESRPARREAATRARAAAEASPPDLVALARALDSLITQD